MFERAEVMGYCGVMGGAHESNKSAPNVSVRSKLRTLKAFEC